LFGDLRIEDALIYVKSISYLEFAERFDYVAFVETTYLKPLIPLQFLMKNDPTVDLFILF